MLDFKTSSDEKEIIKSWEGLSLTAYTDIVGKITIGYGHVINILLDSIQLSGSITLIKALELFEEDIIKAENSVNKLVQVPITQGQFNALVSLVFNVGEHDLKESKALKLLNNKNYNEASIELFSEERGFVFAGGKRNKGLINRRQTEYKMWRRGG